MGGGRWDTDLYSASARMRRSTGTPDFDYHARTAHGPRSTWKAAPELDPRLIKDSPFGVRESRDSDEHPETRAIAVFFDVTGSMGIIPQQLQQKLGFLMEFIIGRAGIEHPQIMIGAIGDATCDAVPFQISQFESDNRIDEWLRLLFLEGGGGGQKSESYGLAYYAAARKMALDCVEKRGQKGYCFTIGDEMSWPVRAEEVERIFGDRIEVPRLDVADLLREAQEKFDVFHIIATKGAHGADAAVEQFWRKLLGERVLRFSDADKVCELIAGQIALMEGVDLADIKHTVGDAVAGALVPGGTGSGWHAPAATASGPLQAPPNQAGRSTRF